MFKIGLTLIQAPCRHRGHRRRALGRTDPLSLRFQQLGHLQQRQLNSPAVKLSLVAYSTPQAAYKQLIAAFQKTPAGKNVTFSQSYGASGDQSRAVASGLKADIVDFSLAPDMTRLVKAKLVASNWDSNQYKGMITDSGGGARRPQGQPEAHHLLERPDQARRLGHRPEPGHVGRRALGHHGRLRRGVEQGR